MKNTISIISMTLLLTVFFVFGVCAQQNSSPVKYEKTTIYRLQNVNNEFMLNGVGKVIVKGNADNEIRCEVKVTGYGKTVEDAKAHAENVRAEASNEVKATPKLQVSMYQGRYNERVCQVVTTVYLPATVVMQHNDDISIMDYVFRVLDKVKVLRN